jgi:DNA-binding GntR family transcriptional regulator
MTITTVARVVEALREGIREGRWVPGQRMVEADLTEEMAVGRGPIREALRILSGDGLVELIPHRGARIRRVDKSEAVNIQQVLGTLQFLSADLILAQPICEEDISELRERYTAIVRAVERRDRGEIMRAALAYQSHCNVMSRNPYIELAMRRLNVEFLSGAVAAALETGALVEAVSRHGELTEAFARQDADLVRAIMRESYERVIAAFSPAS